MAIIEMELWKKNPDRPGTLIFDSQRAAQDIFNELEAHLKSDGRMPDEYFLLNIHWQDGVLFPKDAEILCNVNYGGSEGVYLDVFVQYKKDVYERSQDTGELGWQNRTVTERFATGKTLGDHIDDLDKMNLVASSVMAAFYGMEGQVKERYATIESGAIEPTYPLPPKVPDIADVAVQAIFGKIQDGDMVIATANNDYKYLLGAVTAIDKLGTPEHGTDNETDDIHVDFTAFDYPPERITEIEEHFANLYGKAVDFDELPLDDVIMAPKMLISITNLDSSEINRMGNLRANCEAFCNCFPSGERPEGKHGELMERLDKNLTDYHAMLDGFGNRELIEMAEKIAAMSNAHMYMTSCEFYESELDFYLQFQNPLEVVADAYCEHFNDVDDDMSVVVNNVFYRKDGLDSYPLMPDAPGLSSNPPEAEQPDMSGLIDNPRLYSTIRVCLKDRNSDGIPDALYDKAAEYATAINEAITSFGTDKYWGNDLFNHFSLPGDYQTEKAIRGKILGASLSVHPVGDALFAALDLKMTQDLTAAELEKFTGQIETQFRDGWGAEFELKDIPVDSENAVFLRLHHDELEFYTADKFSAIAEKLINAEHEKHAGKIAGNAAPVPPANKPPAAKPKTLADKLQAGKAKAEAYKAQNPQTTTKNTKKEID